VLPTSLKALLDSHAWTYSCPRHEKSLPESRHGQLYLLTETYMMVVIVVDKSPYHK
jgi:hypothetical protein